MTLRVLIVDDEAAARRGLCRRLSAEAEVEVVGECDDGPTAVAAISESSPDVVFLDVQMPGMSGFDVIDAVGMARMPAVVFVTAFEEFALRAFAAHALDYLLKPIDGDRFRDALERARRQAMNRRVGADDRIAAALAEFAGLGMVRAGRWAKRLPIRLNGRVILVAVSDIERVEAAGNYVEIHVGRRRHLLRETLTSLAERLDPEAFQRVSRSALVALERVAEYRPIFNGDFVVVMRDGTEVPGSRRYRAGFEERLR